MTEQQELELKALVESGVEVLWNPDNETGRKVVYVGTWKSKDPAVEDEPGLCAYFDGGQYAALYNCEMSEFVIAKRLTNA